MRSPSFDSTTLLPKRQTIHSRTHHIAYSPVNGYSPPAYGMANQLLYGRTNSTSFTHHTSDTVEKKLPLLPIAPISRQPMQRTGSGNDFLASNQQSVLSLLPQRVKSPRSTFPPGHQQLSAKLQNRIMKTKLCVHHLHGRCGRGQNCAFAHSVQELRTLPNLYKTRLCTNFCNSGCCPKGDICRFAHGETELRTCEALSDSTEVGADLKKGESTDGIGMSFASSTLMNAISSSSLMSPVSSGKSASDRFETDAIEILLNLTDQKRQGLVDLVIRTVFPTTPNADRSRASNPQCMNDFGSISQSLASKMSASSTGAIQLPKRKSVTSNRMGSAEGIANGSLSANSFNGDSEGEVMPFQHQSNNMTKTSLSDLLSAVIKGCGEASENRFSSDSTYQDSVEQETLKEYATLISLCERSSQLPASAKSVIERNGGLSSSQVGENDSSEYWLNGSTTDTLTDDHHYNGLSLPYDVAKNSDSHIDSLDLSIRSSPLEKQTLMTNESNETSLEIQDEESNYYLKKDTSEMFESSQDQFKNSDSVATTSTIFSRFDNSESKDLSDDTCSVISPLTSALSRLPHNEVAHHTSVVGQSHTFDDVAIEDLLDMLYAKSAKSQI